MPKKQITTKMPVPKKSAAKKAMTTKSTVAGTTRNAMSKTPARKAAAIPKTSSLVHAMPLTTVSPKKPEQLLYEPDLTKDVNDGGTAIAETPVVKRGRGRPRKNPEVAPTTALIPEVAQPAPAQPAAPPTVLVQPAQAAPAAPSVSSQRRLRKSGLRINVRLLAALTVLVVLVAGGWYWHAAHAQDTASANAKLIAEIGQHVVLPRGETPTISTVVDESKLNQDFLKNAKKGDKVLLYFQSSQAIVYRPSTGQVVNMGPLQTPRPRVFIRQGSNVDNVGAVRTVIGSSSEFLVTSQDQSVNKTYDKTIVVDLTGNRPDLAGQLAQLLHVNVGNLPAGEIPPDADLMVIVGSDFK